MLVSYGYIFAIALLIWVLLNLLGLGLSRLLFPGIYQTAIGRVLGIIGILILTVSFYGIIKSHGNTISWLYLVSFCAAIAFLPRRKEKPIQSYRNLFWIDIQVFFIFILAFFWISSYFMPSFGNNLNFVFTDNLYYSKLATLMMKKGVEINSYNYFSAIDNQLDGRSPYHYFELWLTALIAEIFQLSTVQVFEQIIFPLFIGTAFWGLLSIFESLGGKVNIWTGSVIFICLIFPGLNTRFLSIWLDQRIGLQYHILGLGGGKILPLMPVFFTAISLFVRELKASGLILLALCTFFSIVLFPLWLAIGVILIWPLFRNSRNWSSTDSRAAVSLFLLGFFFACYYLYHSSPEINQEQELIWINKKLIVKFLKEIRFQFVIFSLLFINYTLVFIWYFLIKKSNFNMIFDSKVFFFTGIFFSFLFGIAIWAFTPFFFDGFQFYWIIRTIIIPVIGVYALYFIFKQKFKSATAFIILISCLIFPAGWAQQNLFQSHAHPPINQNFADQLKIHLKTERVTWYGLLYLKKTKDLTDHPFALRYFGQEPTMINSHYMGYPLSILSDTFLLESKPLQSFLRHNPLLSERDRAIKSGQNLTENQIIERVVWKKQMPFVFCENRKAMVPELRKWVTDSIENKDNKNIIYFLKTKNP